MATNPQLNKKELEELLKLSNLLEKGLNSIDLENLNKSGTAAKTLLEALRKEAETLTSDISSAAIAFKDIVGEIRKTDMGLNQAAKSFNKLSSIAEKVQYHQKEISLLSIKEVENLQKQAKQELEKLGNADSLLKTKAAGLQQEINYNDALLKNLKAKNVWSERDLARSIILEKKQEKLNEKLRINKNTQDEITGTIEGNNAAYNVLVSTLDKINRELEEEKKKLGLTGALLEGLNKIPFLNGIIDTNKALDAAKEKIKDGGNRFQAMSAAVSTVGKQITTHLSDPLFIVGFLVTELISTFKSVDSAIGDLAKGFDMSYNSAANLRMELTDIANSSMDVAVTTKGLQESMMAIGQTLGSNARLNSADLVTFTKLREQAGYTNEELAGIQKLTLATGGSLEDNTASFLGSVAALNGQNKLTINAKQLLKEVANVSDSIKLSIGGTTEKLAEAAFKAKQFGINLQQADQISQSLLDFESSIGNELSAELITGKDLNLEKARLLAINGDIAGASAEILKQVGGTAEFTKMNRIQQEAIAKATGLSRDDLAKSLMDKEALVALSGVEGKDAKEKYDNLVKQVGVEEAKKRLGNEALANQFQQQSVQERFTQSIEKLKELFVSLLEPLMPVFDVFADIMGVVGPIVGVLGTIIKYTMQWGKYLLYAVGIYKTLKFLGDSTYRNTILTNIAKKTGVITDQQANFQAIRRNMLTNGNIMSENTMATIKKRSLGTVILTNIQEKLGLATKEGGLLLTIKDSAIKFKDFVLEKGKNALLLTGNILKAIGNTLGIIGVGIQKAGNRSAGKGLLSKAGEFIMGMFSAGAKAPFPLNLVLPFILGGIAGGIAATVIGKFMKGDDVVSPGYGKRTLMSPEGAITLNDKDTVIAGTNLGGKGNSKGNSQQSAYMDPTLLNEMRAMRQEQARSNNKPVVVENSMNGTKFGTALHMNTYKIQ
jgi:hypothetical protein